MVKKEEFMYIPLLESLQCLLNNTTIIQEVAVFSHLLLYVLVMLYMYAGQWWPLRSI